MPRHRSRSRSASPLRRNRYDEPREHRRDRRSSAPSGLLVRNISLSARPEDIKAPFERFGPLKDVYLPKNYYTGEPRGFGFVKFCYPEDAADAKDHLDRAIIGGREIRIVFAEENRKTPLEMRRVPHVSSSRRSHRRRSPSLSPRRRRHSYSRSLSPPRRNSRGHKAKDDRYSPPRSRSVSPRDGKYKSREKSPRHSRSLSCSVSPRDGKYKAREKSPRHSRSLSRFVSPRKEKKRQPNCHSLSPKENGRNGDEPSGSPSLLNSRSSVKSPSRSHSPR